MAVDTFIHVLEPHIDDATLKCFFHNHAGHELEDFHYQCPDQPRIGSCRHFNDIANVDSIEVGEKHWCHPWWTGQAPDELDDPISTVAGAFSDFDVITPAIIEKVDGAYQLPSTRMFKMDNLDDYHVRVVDFLKRNIGKRIFIVGW